MALDNAQFISELSITDPPGTDAVAEGDDHIRTTKRATQQSFPNVDAAVPQTAAQMGQMAIKNEVNTFTQTNVFTARNDFQNIRFDAAVGTTRGLQYFLAGLQNWAVSNNFNVPALQFQRHDPATGIFVDTPISIDNTTGEITLSGNGVTNFDPRLGGGGQVDIRFRDLTQINRWTMRQESDALGNDWVLRQLDSSGVLVSTVIRVAEPSGAVTFANATVFNGTITVPSATIQLRQAGTGTIDYRFQTETGFSQWILRRSSDANNNDFQINRRDAGGGNVDTPFQIRFVDGLIIMNVLPASDPGVSGALYRVSGDVRVSL